MVNDIVKDLEGSVAKAHDSLKRELAKVRTGRANLALLDGAHEVGIGNRVARRPGRSPTRPAGAAGRYRAADRATPQRRRAVACHHLA